MSQTVESFETLKRSLKSILPGQGSYSLRQSDHSLVLETPADVAAFSLFNGHVKEEFDAAYREFKALYREHHTEWDTRTLSFVLCRASGNAADDKFYAEREHDPLFCRKYVIHAHGDVTQQSQELLRLPFLPFPDDEALNLLRPQSAQDLLQSAGVAASMTRKLVELGRRAPDGIVDDLLNGKESLPQALTRSHSAGITPVKPRAVSRLTNATIESFRAYRKPQSFKLDASVVVLYGPNGLGKTSFFDAIDYACTGRIGRLCRQRKFNQEDFSRVATYLDDTAGTGSVVLTGHSGPGDANPESWILRRGTGNWSTAWVGDEKQDRIETLTFLTNAEWGETRPRQQNVESLFRATHLFGQDEQELLVDFRKSSMLPETFVSEMLALQDYSQGLDKTKDVSQLLIARKSSLQSQIATVQSEKTSLAESLATEAGAGESLTQDAVEKMAAEIRVRVSDPQLPAKFPSGLISAELLEGWIDVTSAHVDSIESRLNLARPLRSDLAVFHRAAEKILSDRQAIATLDAELSTLAGQKTSLQTQLADVGAKVTSFASLRIDLERRRRELEMAQQWSARREERMEQLQQARSEQAAAEERVVTAEAALGILNTDKQSLISLRDDCVQQVASCKSKRDALQDLSEGSAAYEAAERELKDVLQRLHELGIKQKEEQQRLIQLRERAMATEAKRKQLAPEHDRFKAQQAELETLLDAIQSHLSGTDCPLCGTDFLSHASLNDRIREHRNQRTAESSIASRFATLKLAEAEAQQQFAEAAASVEALGKSETELKSRNSMLRTSIATYIASANAVLAEDSSRVEQSAIASRLAENMSELEELNNKVKSANERLRHSEAQCDASEKELVNLKLLARQCGDKSRSFGDELTREDARVNGVLAAERIADSQVASSITTIQGKIDATFQSLEQLRRARELNEAATAELDGRVNAATLRRAELKAELQANEAMHATFRSRLSDVQLPDNPDMADQTIKSLENTAIALRQVITDAGVLRDALRNIQARTSNDRVRKQIEACDAQATNIQKQLATVEALIERFREIEALLKAERQASVQNHIAAYGPLISNIQQRLRSVYGFGGVHLDARGGEAAVQVEWRNKDIQLRPTDFFSDSQKQILMLSVFLAGGLRQNWSGFAPVLLDDPVTHFDDLNAYGFVELIRGIIATKPSEWQFIISTCEERLFSLMQKKFGRFDGSAIFYEFLGMTDDGPIVEQR